MIVERRQALALAVGMAVAGSNTASACTRAPPPIFKPTARERSRMVQYLELLQSYWNDGKSGRYLEEYCVEHLSINYILDGRGGNWRDPIPAVRLFQERYPKMMLDFSGIMFDPSLPFIYAIGEFDALHQPTELIELCSRGAKPAFAIQMRFVESYEHDAPRLPADDRLVAQICFREHQHLINLFRQS